MNKQKMAELVVLVDEHNNPIGTADKATVHTSNTPLHRAFSLFLFNSKKQLLLTKRAATKKTFPGIWTNTVCGHLSPDETPEASAIRRLKEELGIEGVNVRLAAPYRYRFSDANGIVENEICPILIADFDEDPKPNPMEIDDWKWMDWQEFIKEITQDRTNVYSPWCREEAQIINSLESIHVW